MRNYHTGTCATQVIRRHLPKHSQTKQDTTFPSFSYEYHTNIISRESTLGIVIHYPAAEALTTPDPFCHHVVQGACIELLIDTHLKSPFQSHFFTGHNSHQGFNSHSLSLPSHPHDQPRKLMLSAARMTFRSASCQKKSCSPRGTFCSSPGWLWKAFWSDVSLCSTHPAQVRRKQVEEVSTYQAHPPWRSGCCCCPMQVCSGSSNQTPTKCSCLHRVALSLHQFEPKVLTLPSFKQEAVFSAEQGYNQINKDLQVSSSSAIPPLVCSLCIIYSHKEEAKENKKRKRENPIKEICSLGQAGQAQKGNIHCHQSAPRMGEERWSSVLHHINYLPTDFLRNM